MKETLIFCWNWRVIVCGRGPSLCQKVSRFSSLSCCTPFPCLQELRVQVARSPISLQLWWNELMDFFPWYSSCWLINYNSNINYFPLQKRRAKSSSREWGLTAKAARPRRTSCSAGKSPSSLLTAALCGPIWTRWRARSGWRSAAGFPVDMLEAGWTEAWLCWVLSFNSDWSRAGLPRRKLGKQSFRTRESRSPNSMQESSRELLETSNQSAPQKSNPRSLRILRCSKRLRKEMQ